MLARELRSAIRTMHAQGHGPRAITRMLRVSRNAVRRVLAAGDKDGAERKATPPEPSLPLERVQELMVQCKGNRVRVHEELAREGFEVTYPTLTRWMRIHKIGMKVRPLAGRYHFEPGEEMQHDTSPIDCVLAGQKCRVQCASLVLCFSRRVFAECSLRFNRFQCRLFLTHALRWFPGSAHRCMIDNSSVIVASGSGRLALMAPEMEAFGHRFGFRFEAHRVGDANRSARVERPFDFIQQNFFAGRTFESLEDLNAQLRAWCETVDHRVLREFRMTRLALFAMEQSSLVPLPAFVPEPIRVHRRIVDVEGYVSIDDNRYSVDATTSGHTLELHETATEVRIFTAERSRDEPLCVHPRSPPFARRRSTLPQHEHQARRRYDKSPRPPCAEEATLRAAAPALVPLIEALHRTAGHQAVRQLRALHRLWTEYPAAPLERAVAAALEHRLYDVARIEKRVLMELGHEHFRLPTERDP